MFKYLPRNRPPFLPSLLLLSSSSFFFSLSLSLQNYFRFNTQILSLQLSHSSRRRRMAKQGKGRKSDTNNNNVGKGKVTPVQVAFLVDRYLADNNYSKTRSTFRSEASSVISKSFLQEVLFGLLCLSRLIDFCFNLFLFLFLY